MTRRTLSLAALIACSTLLHGQLVVNNTQTVNDLVQNVLLGGGVTVSNITFNGMPGNGITDQVGSFNSANANVGIGNGVFMATGNVQVALGPNNVDAASIPISGLSYADADLQTLADGQEIFDAAILEFDFIPSGNQVSFNFVFASEEYLEFVYEYNDVFGFFLSGPGISGPYANNAANIALIPGTTTPVSINSLNANDYSAYFVDNGDGFTFPYNSSPQYIQFDGFTTPITASATVQCGQQYHIKLAVGDALDPLYDSGVFLQANAFSSPSMDLSVSPDVNLPCDGSVEVSILGLTGGIGPYSYSWSYNGTTITTDQTITVGQGANGTYTATVTDGCGSTVQEQVVVGAPVSPPITLNVTPSQNLQCNGTLEIAVLSIAGGTPPFTYVWSLNGTTLTAGQTYTVANNAPGTYVMTVNDDCGGSIQQQVVVGAPVSPPMTLTLTPSQSLPCNGTLDIAVLGLTGGTAPFTYAWSLNGTTLTTDQNYTVANNAPGTYTMSVADNCGGSTQGTVVVTSPVSPPMTLTLTPDAALNCLGTATVGVLNVAGGTPPFAYTWSVDGTVVGTTASISVPAAEAGTYTVTVDDDCNGTQQGTVVVGVPPPAPLVVSVTPDFALPCQGEEECAVLSIAQGIAPYTYAWTMNGTALANTPSVEVVNGDQGTYAVTVTDVCGAVGTGSLEVFPPDVDPIVVTMDAELAVDCIGDVAQVSVTGVTGGDGQYSYAWSQSGVSLLATGPSMYVSVDADITYTVTVTDNCLGSGEASIDLLAPDPLVVNLPTTVYVCENGSADLVAQPTGGSGPGSYTYLWTAGEVTTESYTIFPVSDTTFTLRVIDACNDTVFDVVNVRIEIPVVTAFATNIAGDEFSFTAQCVPDNATYAWSFSSGTGRTGNPVENTFADLDVYWATVTATTAAGCTDVDTVYMEPASQLHFPNAFTPDGDGINDLFGPVGYQLEEVEFSIYDRWGAVVYTTNAPGRGWDGRFANGTPAPTGVYVYTFRAKGERLTQREGYGSVTLLGQAVAQD